MDHDEDDGSENGSHQPILGRYATPVERRRRRLWTGARDTRMWTPGGHRMPVRSTLGPRSGEGATVIRLAGSLWPTMCGAVHPD